MVCQKVIGESCVLTPGIFGTLTLEYITLQKQITGFLQKSIRVFADWISEQKERKRYSSTRIWTHGLLIWSIVCSIFTVLQRTMVVLPVFYLPIYKRVHELSSWIFLSGTIEVIHTCNSQLIFNRYGEVQVTVSSRLQYQVRNNNSVFFRKNKQSYSPSLHLKSQP